ncbi:MAG: trypsin-like peptidase domain-containing protein [Acidobacteriota bacterium]|nr:trypsin-like peptidase domain-containing protein [Acidobacteriota bacterium]
MRSAVAVAMLALGLPHSLPLWAVTQDTGVLRITVVLTDADGNVTPIPRVVLLVSDNPATSAPRRVRTGPDGAVEIRLPPGNYTVESDAPVTLGAQSYAWTQTIDVTRGSNALSLTPANAEINTDTGGASGVGAPMRADSAVIFTKWRHSLVQIWTPTSHASGFLIDARGFIATNERSMGDATAVEVEFSGFKIAGRVIASDKQQGVAIIWIDPATVSSIPVIGPDCSARPGATVKYEQKVVTLVAPMLEPKSAILGTVGRVETVVFDVDWRLTGGAAGGPVFSADGRPIGITLADEEREDSRRRDSQAIALSNACSVLAAAEKKIAGATAPPGTRLRVEDSRAATRARVDKPSTFALGASADKKGLSPQDPKAPRLSIPTVSSSNFDISLMTPAMADSDAVRSNPRTDFGQWTDYVINAPPVLLVRVTPQFEESLWKTIMRGAAATQGVGLPPLKSFSANFLRLRAFCGTAEVAPIHPFTIVRELQDRASIREGLYVFAVGDFGPHCGAVRFDLYSERSPDRADTLNVDPKLLAQISAAQ